MKRTALRFAIINGVLLVCAVAISLFYLFVKEHGITAFDCAFMRVFGFSCPGCGATRAVLALLTLRFSDALMLSPGVSICVFLLLLYDLLAVCSLILRRPSIERAFPPKLLFLIPVCFLVPFVFRLLSYFLF